jgi:hypothetical protein
LGKVTGAAYLGSITTHPVEKQWFSSVAVLALATFVPTILVPLLGSLFSSMTNIVSSGVGFGGMIHGASHLGHQVLNRQALLQANLPAGL